MKQLIILIVLIVLISISHTPPEPLIAIEKPLGTIEQRHVQDYKINFQELEINYTPTEVDLFQDQLSELNQKETSIINKIKENKEIYSLDPTCDWRLLGAIHYRETNLGNTNGWNGQGAFQNIRNKYVSNSLVSDWSTQVHQACSHLKNKVGTTHLNESTPIDVIGTALARYNGCNNKHWKECGYTAYKLSDNHTSFMKCSIDFSCLPLVPDRRLGALTIYLNLHEQTMEHMPKSNFNCTDSLNC